MDQFQPVGEKAECSNQFYNIIKEENANTTSVVDCDTNLTQLLDRNWTKTCVNEYDNLVVCKDELLEDTFENGYLNEDIVDPLLPVMDLRMEDNRFGIQNNVRLVCMTKPSNDAGDLQNIDRETEPACSQENTEIQEECTRVLEAHLAKISALSKRNRKPSEQSRKENVVRSSKFYKIEERSINGIRKLNLGVDVNTIHKQNTKTIVQSSEASYNLRHRRPKEATVPFKAQIYNIKNQNKNVSNSLIILGPATKENKLKNKVQPSTDQLKMNKIILGNKKTKVIHNKSSTKSINRHNEETLIEKNNFPIAKENMIQSGTENIKDIEEKSVRNTKFGNCNKQSAGDNYNKFSSNEKQWKNNKTGAGIKKTKVINKPIRKITRTINKQNENVGIKLSTVKEKKVKNVIETVTQEKELLKKNEISTKKKKPKLVTNQNETSTKRILGNKKHDKAKLPRKENNNITESVTVKENVQSETTVNIRPVDIKMIHAEYINQFKPKYICDICNFETNRRKYIESHLHVHNDAKLKLILSCDHCEYISNNKHYLQRHMRKHTGIKRFSCKICSHESDRKSHLRDHMMTHIDVKPYSCDQCNYRCMRKDMLVFHEMTHTGHKPYSCMFCSFKSIRKSSVGAHMKTHTGERRFHCDICNFKFMRKQCLINHIRAHNNVKPFSCKYCKYKCVRKVDLVVHERRHTGEKPFACKLCNFKATRNITLIYHMRSHTGEKPFSCHLCNYKGRMGHQLLVHMRTHTGEKPFLCKECDYRCADKSSLNKHLRVHTRETPYVCQQCKYRFKDSSTLKRHMKIHGNERNFSCEICPFKSIQKCDLVRHMKKHK